MEVNYYRVAKSADEVIQRLERRTGYKNIVYDFMECMLYVPGKKTKVFGAFLKEGVIVHNGTKEHKNLQKGKEFQQALEKLVELKNNNLFISPI